ncbi:zinc finger MYM-type protein 1-like [Gigantopelta aegis]|uniref:zinc finger MYM-type protein 1-like n=1 Tax=Gigantopelta aegis TaxID=1735272 RepID=UPI001B888BE0|nr:zinc finger MYM-type protein 1-like [Gigantopelta aegis]
MSGSGRDSYRCHHASGYSKRKAKEEKESKEKEFLILFPKMTDIFRRAGSTSCGSAPETSETTEVQPSSSASGDSQLISTETVEQEQQGTSMAVKMSRTTKTETSGSDYEVGTSQDTPVRAKEPHPICQKLRVTSSSTLGTCVLDRIIYEVKEAKHYSVSVDSTPDLSHVDQLTIILRYVLPSGPVERFVKFLHMQGHSGEQLAQNLSDFLAEHNISLSDCRGQSYDNASNMSGRYSGMQAHARKLNPLAEYVPCAGHSLNLVGQFTASCCEQATMFFDFIQRLYVFFSASTYRWSLLTDALSENKLPCLKRMSDTRWSARADALKALYMGYSQINNVIDSIAADENQKGECRQEARGLAAMWHQVLERFQMCSASLHSADQDLNTACALYKSLIVFVQKLRPTFEDTEQKAKELTNSAEYRQDTQRVRKRNRKYDHEFGLSSEEEKTETAANKFRVGTFLVIIDSLISALKKRLKAYEEISNKFGFLRNLGSMSEEQRSKLAMALINKYPNDLEASLANELLQFVALLNTEFGKRVTTTDPSASQLDAAADDQDNTAMTGGEALELLMYRLIRDHNMQSCVPNIEMMLRMYLCMVVTNCTGDRSFSKLRRIKNAQRTTMGEKRLNMLTLMSIECELLRTVDTTSIIKDFAHIKSRRRDI